MQNINAVSCCEQHVNVTWDAFFTITIKSWINRSLNSTGNISWSYTGVRQHMGNPNTQKHHCTVYSQQTFIHAWFFGIHHTTYTTVLCPCPFRRNPFQYTTTRFSLIVWSSSWLGCPSKHRTWSKARRWLSSAELRCVRDGACVYAWGCRLIDNGQWAIPSWPTTWRSLRIRIHRQDVSFCTQGVRSCKLTIDTLPLQLLAMWIERNSPPGGGALFTMFPDCEHERTQLSTRLLYNVYMRSCTTGNDAGMYMLFNIKRHINTIEKIIWHINTFKN